MHEMILPQIHLNFCKTYVADSYATNLKKNGLVLFFLFIHKVEGVMSSIAKWYFTQKFLTEIWFYLLFWM